MQRCSYRLSALASLGLCESGKCPQTRHKRCLTDRVAPEVGAAYTSPRRTRSSAGEHFVDIEGVTGSIPVASTNLFNALAPNGGQNSLGRYLPATSPTELDPLVVEGVENDSIRACSQQPPLALIEGSQGLASELGNVLDAAVGVVNQA
jgi:hypothetical protein